MIYKIQKIKKYNSISVFIAFLNEPALQYLIYAAKVQGMLNGDYAFIASSLTLSTIFWNNEFSTKYNINLKDINGNVPIFDQYYCLHAEIRA